MQKPYFPLFTDISQKQIVVVGGGKIAERRVKTLLEFAEHIQVVSPAVTEELHRLVKSGRIDWREEHYTFDAIKDADIVLAATDDAACNEEVAGDCKIRNIPVNAAHKKELCDFYFPAIASCGNIVAGITASGYSHAQAREARKRVEEALRDIQGSEGRHE